jgi:hypothetical protein
VHALVDLGIADPSAQDRGSNRRSRHDRGKDDERPSHLAPPREKPPRGFQGGEAPKPSFTRPVLRLSAPRRQVPRTAGRDLAGVEAWQARRRRCAAPSRRERPSTGWHPEPALYGSGGGQPDRAKGGRAGVPTTNDSRSLDSRRRRTVKPHGRSRWPQRECPRFLRRRFRRARTHP